MSDDFFQVTNIGTVAHLQLNRPERLNTMTPEFFHSLRSTVEALDAEGQTRALVISSTGKHFSAGMSLEVFSEGGGASPVGSARERLQFQRTLRELIAALNALEVARFPVICAVQGGCIGGGLDLATACDIRLCSTDAFFVVQEIAVGMAADLGVLQRLPKIVPQGVARQMAYTGERMGSARALAVGLVNEVLNDHETTLARAMGLAAAIAAKSPVAVAVSKAALSFARDHPVGESLEQMAVSQSAIYDPAEIELAIRAWKRKQETSFASLIGHGR